MAIPGNWPETQKKCKFYADALDKATADLAATIYKRLGISPDLRIPGPQGRPVPLVEEGRPLKELFG